MNKVYDGEMLEAATHPIAKHARIGELLVHSGRLSEYKLNCVLASQGTLKFGEVALRLGVVTNEDVRWALAQQFQFPYADSISPPTAADAVDQNASSIRAEALRSLRSDLALRWFGARQKALSITQARAGDGCSGLAADLALVFAQARARVLLIEADLRNPTYAARFDLKTKTGLSHLLAGRGSVNDAISDVSSLEWLSVLPAGPRPPNPQELLSRKAFNNLLTFAANDFDVIIVDTPPLIPYADAQLVASSTRGCLLATQRNRTRLDDLQQAKARLERTDVTLLGVVIND